MIPHLSLRKSLLKSRTAKSYGPLLLSASTSVAELLAGVGYGHIVVDVEHSPLDMSSTTNVVRAIDASSRHNINAVHSHRDAEHAAIEHASCYPIVRTTSHKDKSTTKKLLDILRPPAGIIFPKIESATDAEAAVRCTRHPELDGIRGLAHPFSRASGYGHDLSHFRQKTSDLMVIVQIESENAIRNIPKIAAVEGVDCIFLGPFDISCSVGRMNQFDKDGEVMKLIRSAEKSVIAESSKRLSWDRGLILGGIRTPGRSLAEMFSWNTGYQFVCGNADLGLLAGAASHDMMEANKAIKPHSIDSEDMPNFINQQ